MTGHHDTHRPPKGRSSMQQLPQPAGPNCLIRAGLGAEMGKGRRGREGSGGRWQWMQPLSQGAQGPALSLGPVANLSGSFPKSGRLLLACHLPAMVAGGWPLPQVISAYQPTSQSLPLASRSQSPDWGRELGMDGLRHRQ